jgi:hypothetical protein
VRSASEGTKVPLSGAVVRGLIKTWRDGVQRHSVVHVRVAVMLWIFARDVQQLHVETRLDRTEGRFVTRILWPDGREQVETFSTEALFRRRLLKLELELREENWMGAAGWTLQHGQAWRTLGCRREPGRGCVGTGEWVNMDGPGSITAAGFVLVLLLRPWRLRDDASREYSALLAAVLLGVVLVKLCVPG